MLLSRHDRIGLSDPRAPEFITTYGTGHGRDYWDQCFGHYMMSKHGKVYYNAIFKLNLILCRFDIPVYYLFKLGNKQHCQIILSHCLRITISLYRRSGEKTKLAKQAD